MRTFLLLRLEAPLLSFGAPSVDQQGVIQPFPALSMISGLIGNALGYDHSEAQLLQALQDRIRYAVRADRPGERVRDYQTVDLGQAHLMGTGWTTHGTPDERGKGEATSGTHIRQRDYWADALFLVALDMREGTPSLDEVADALERPARTLFLGRKPCLPAGPIFWKKVQAENLVRALCEAPPLAPTPGWAHPKPRSTEDSFPAWWPEGEAEDPHSVLLPVTDERDWANQIHVGRRLIRHGPIRLAETSHA